MQTESEEANELEVNKPQVVADMAAPESITEESAGMVYYSEPNRIIFFYQDAEVAAEYTPVSEHNKRDEGNETGTDNRV